MLTFSGSGNDYFAAEMMEYGAHVYKYNGYIHAKTMIVDDELCCIGSVNMDMRSLLVDDEICGVFYENGLVQEYNAIYEEDLQHTKEYVLEEFEKRSTGRSSQSGFLCCLHR